MNPSLPPTISSFMIRFIVEDSSGRESPQPAYHGVIRHIQSAEEINFIQWSEAVEFMRRFVPLENAGGSETNMIEKAP
jgi:hypothetical protein